MYNYALIGFGGLGKLHFLNMFKLEQERNDICLKAICGTDITTVENAVKINLGDIDISNIDFSKYHFYNDVVEMLENEKLDFVISTLPTFLHYDTAIYCLNHGVHVFSEKPMALTNEQCQNMIEVANQNGKLLMIGHCLRFAGVYVKLKEYIDQNTFGKVRRVECSRYSAIPKWTFQNWILDYNKSGGCALDMHIHDVDLINWFFGPPHQVFSFVTNEKMKCESIFTTYFYDDKIITAAADWSFPQKFPFESRFLVQFEHAYVEIINNQIRVYKDDEIILPDCDLEDHFLEEIKEYVECVTRNKKSDIISAESAFQAAYLVFAELDSANKKEIIKL